MDKSPESGSPQRAQVQEISQDTPDNIKYGVNKFLNGLGEGTSYDWTDKKFDFMLRQDPDYHVAYMEKGGQIIAAQDYRFDDGTLNLLRVRTSTDESRIHAQQTGSTLGDEIFDAVLRKNSSAERIYSEVNPNGMRYLKRQTQKRSLTITKELAPDKTGFGVIEINLGGEQQAASVRLQRLRTLRAKISKAA